MNEVNGMAQWIRTLAVSLTESNLKGTCDGRKD